MNQSKVKHKFRKEIFVPWCAISWNIDLAMWDVKKIETSDCVACLAKKLEHVHVLSEYAKEIIKRLYNISAYDFIQMWYKRFPNMDSMSFIYMKLEKIEEKDENKTN